MARCSLSRDRRVEPFGRPADDRHHTCAPSARVCAHPDLDQTPDQETKTWRGLMHRARDRRVGPPTRCLPSDADAQDFFAEPGCTVRIAYDYSASCPPPKYAIRREPGCNPLTRVFRVTSKLTPTDGVLWTGSPGACVSSPMSTPGTYWSLGPEVDPTAFAEGSVALR